MSYRILGKGDRVAESAAPPIIDSRRLRDGSQLVPLVICYCLVSPLVKTARDPCPGEKSQPELEKYIIFSAARE